MSGNPSPLKQVLDETARRLDSAGIESARMEARRLVCWALGCDASALLTRDLVPPSAMARLESGVMRRCARVPMALIEGETGFWNLTLEVSSHTLIPRGDSETLIEALLDLRPDRDKPQHLLDLGTGTGCLLLAALSEYTASFGVGVDLSPDAAALAQRNASRNGLVQRSAFLAGSWTDALTGRFDIILSNPPYIPAADIAGLMPEVRDHEPVRALVGGDDGLEAYRAIMLQMSRHLAPGGLLVLEIGQGQEDDVTALGAEQGLSLREARRDLGGIIRALCFEHV
ncbi:peptide chain release factor N(5)-glutamine methyltransferase [Asaia bogorensis]|uniref:peptide chain release factor N(5)-glutamine methyltransferase n=1 Tax=Asaia bogorensis TaxID=91915 RepID=UPI0013CF3BC8|nr:peptide chain release factor N(5)-glutamine methyltransferase [Asaia bogorensis]